MKFTVKQSSTGNWIVYLKGHGQFGESYVKKDDAIRACQHYSQNHVDGYITLETLEHELSEI